MSLEELNDDVTDVYGDLGDGVEVDLDRETRTELAMLVAVLDPEDVDELLRRGVHALFRSTVDTGDLDFHLRNAYDLTYDEYLMGETRDTYMNNTGSSQPDRNDNRRYQQ